MMAIGEVRQANTQRGTALVIAVTMMFVLVIMGGTMVTLTLARSKRNVERIQLEDLRGALEGAISIAVGRINAETTPPAALAGVIQGGSAQGTNWAVNVRRNGNLYKISAAVSGHRLYRHAQMIVEKRPSLPPVPGGLRGAVTSYYGLDMHANLAITGNNHDFDGNQIPLDPGSTYGISTHDTAANILNNGRLSGANQGATGDNEAAIAAGILKVNDEDDFPNSPGKALGITDAEVIARAVAGGTYFTNATQFNTWLSRLGGQYAPNTSPIYLAYETGRNGNSPISNIRFDPAKAYILINHVPARGVEPAPGEPPNGTARTGNVHIEMKGIVIFDDPKHINGGSVINGAVVSLWGTAGVQNKFGQGGAVMKYSTAAIGRALGDGLGIPGSAGSVQMVSWRESPTADADAYAALGACGVNTTSMPAADPANSAGWTLP